MGRGNPRPGRVLVLVGTFVAPLSQWFVFWLLARSDGPGGPGEFATVMAYATPIFVASGWGLRNTCITIRRAYPFSSFLRLRAAGIMAGLILLACTGALVGLQPVMVVAVAIMKSADAVVDILYAPLQKSGRLVAFGSLMVLNGVVTSLAAGGIAICHAPAGVVVLGSSSGSLVTAVAAATATRRPRPDGGRAPAAGSLRRLTAASAPVAIAQAAAVLVANLPTWIVSGTGSAVDVGRFAGAAYILTVGSLLGSSLNSMYIGEYQSMVVTRGPSGLVTRVVRASGWILLCGAVCAVGVYALGPALLHLVYGGEFVYSPWFLVLMTSAAVLNPGTHVLNAALLALNLYRTQMRVVLWALALGAAVVVPCAVWSVPAVWSGAVSAAVTSGAKFVLSMRCIGSLKRSRCS